MYKKEFIIVVLNLAIIITFGLIAIGSSSEQSAATSSHVDAARAGAQNAYCISSGYHALGYYAASECKSRCINAGYSAWCTGDVAGVCYCK